MPMYHISWLVMTIVARTTNLARQKPAVVASLEGKKEPAALVGFIHFPKSSPHADCTCLQVQTSAARIVRRTVKPNPSVEPTQTRLEKRVPLMYVFCTLEATGC